MSRFTFDFGGFTRQSQKRTVVWSTDVADNSKPLPDIPKVGMTDDEAKEKSKELATIRESKKQTQAQTGLENFEFASSSKPIGQYVQMNANGLQTAFVSPLSENDKKLQRTFQFGMHDGNFVNQSAVFSEEENMFIDVNQLSASNERGKISRRAKFETQSSEDYDTIGQDLGPLSDFAVEKAVQISKLSEGEKKRQRSLRFGTQSIQNLQSQKSKAETQKSQELELEQLGTRVKDFVDTAKLYAQVQYAISETSSEMISNESGRTRAWDYFDDGFKAELKAEARVESLFDYQKNSRVVLEDVEKVNESELKPENDLVFESGDIETRDDVNVNSKVVQVVDEDLSFVPIKPVSDPNENFEVASVHDAEETTSDGDKKCNDEDDNVVIDNDISEESVEEEIVPSFRFSTVCDLRDEVLGSPPPAPFQLRREELQREIALKRKAAFKMSAIKVTNDREPATERLRRRKDRLAFFDANRAHSIATVLSQLDSAVSLDTPAERLFRLEHPEYFPKESVESREERLREYERARSAYDAHVAKLMAKQENRQEKVIQKRLRELEDGELLQEAKKVARQKVQEEMCWTPPSDADIWKWKKERGKLPPAEDEEYDEKESDEENNGYYAFEESLESSKVIRSSLRRNEKVLSYSQLRRRVRERERNKKVQLELVKMQEMARKYQIEDLRNQVLEEERTRKRQKLVDLSNERDRRDAKTIQHIREVAASKIAIGRAIRELEDKIAEAEAQLSRKRRFEDMVNDQSFYMKCIRYEELQNGTKNLTKRGAEVDPETDYLIPEPDKRKLQEGLIESEISRKAKGKARRHY